MVTSGGGRVAVVGSANLDVVVRVERLVGPGETVLGGELVETAGGKGLNQAVAVARTAEAMLIACVGDDDAGRLLLASLEAAGIGTDQVRTVTTRTGRALIQVAANGENSIVVAPAANAEVTPGHVRDALTAIRPDLVLAQLEVPLVAVLAAAEWASAHGARFVLNASPARPLPEELLAACDPLVVNVHEAASLLGEPAGRDVEHLAARLAPHASSVVVTDGPRGAWVAYAHTTEHFQGVPVETVVDTTGAGDEFVGRLAGRLGEARDLSSAVTAANRAAARVVAIPRDQR